MGDLTRLVWQYVITDTVDTSANNPCLLTLANRSPQRIEASSGTGPATPSSGLFSATTVAGGGAAAGQPVVPITSSANYRDLMDVWIAGTGGNPGEAARVARGGVAAGQVTLTGPLLFTHAAGALVSPLPTIITDAEPRQVVKDPSYYWHLVVGPEHEFPTAHVEQRAPTRLYEALFTASIYDSSPSRALAEAVRDRLDWLLNLGEAGGPNPQNNGVNPSPLLGTPGPTLKTWLEAFRLVEGPEPHFDYSSLTLQHPMHFRADYSKVYQ